MRRPRCGRAAAGGALLAALGLAATGCATGGLSGVLEARLRSQIRERGLDPDDVVMPFQPTEEMRHWVRDEVGRAGDEQQKVEHLLQAILNRPQGRIVYERGQTATAAEVWDSGRASCLSFTHLFVGLARALELPVYYLRVEDLQSFEKDGDLVVASDHVTAAIGPAGQRRVLDFSDRPIVEYRDVRQISDLTAVALHYSNVGARRIRDGRTEEALSLLETATRLDPDLADGWLNLGVARRRLGRFDDAEAAYRRALETDPEMLSAYTNLAALLSRLGRGAEAGRLLELTDQRSNRNPFTYLALGDLSLREGRLDEAERFYRRSLRLSPENAEPLAALGLWALAAGRRDDAERWLERARKLDPAAPRVGELERGLSAPPRDRPPHG